MPILIGVGAFVVVLGVIGAVAGSGSKKDGTASSPNAAPAATVASTPAAGSSSAPAAAAPTTARFGDTYTYTDGLAVTVSKVASYTPSQYAAGIHPGDAAIVLTVKLTNGSKKAFDMSLVGVNVKAGADGVAGEQIFDDNSGTGFSGSVVPGSSASAKFAFDIPKGATGALDVEVQPDSGLDYASWHWVGQLP